MDFIYNFYWWIIFMYVNMMGFIMLFGVNGKGTSSDKIQLFGFVGILSGYLSSFYFVGLNGGVAIIIFNFFLCNRISNRIVFLIFKKYFFSNADKMQYKDFNNRTGGKKNQFSNEFHNYAAQLNKNNSIEEYAEDNSMNSCLNDKKMQKVFKKFNFTDQKLEELIKILYIIGGNFIAKKVREDSELMEYYLKSVKSGDGVAMQFRKIEERLGL